MNELLKHNKYFFLLAHPDDEVYCSVLIKRLINLKKKVLLAYATSGDAGGNPNEREKEVWNSVKKTGIKKGNVYFLRTPEMKLLDNLQEVVSLSLRIIKELKPDCIVGQDYEGGHEGHDAVSFCAAEVVRLAGIKNHFVFPIYHGKPQKRKGARFKPQRKKYITLKLEKSEQTIKKASVDAHNSQKNYFDGLQKSCSNYTRLLFAREVYFKISRPIDFSKKPMREIGYEYHRNGFKFSDFKKSVVKYNKKNAARNIGF